MSGLTIFLGGWPELDWQGREEADRYEPDDAEAQMLAEFKRCQQVGHQWHTCPACGDHACLRCGTASNA
jgi:hypothetical protein